MKIYRVNTFFERIKLFAELYSFWTERYPSRMAWSIYLFINNYIETSDFTEFVRKSAIQENGRRRIC